MNNISQNVWTEARFNQWYSIPVLVVIVLAGLFVGQGLGVMAAIFTTHLKLNEVPYLVSPPFTDDKRLPVYLLQGFGTLIGFLLSGYLYLHYLEKINPARLFKRKGDLSIFGISVLLVIVFMFANSFLIDWNSNLHFPAGLKGFESWARGKEDDLKSVTDFLTHFTGPADFIVAFVVIVLIPAFGEELLFRGIIQNKLEVIFRNGHAAIWISAILFSAFHFQFFGFVPRVMLGVLFGYMYYWSRSLWFPVMAHFINNGFTLIMIYLYNLRMVPVNIQEEQAYSWTTTLVFAIIGFVLLFYYRRYFILKAAVTNE